MAEKKKKKMEFRYYQLPPGSPILALLGEKWVQNYGDRTADRLHFHNYMELGYCYYGAGDVVLGDDCEFPYKSRVMGTSEPLKPLKAPYMARNPVKWGFFRLKGQEIPLKI